MLACGCCACAQGNPSFKRAATFDKGTYTCSNNAQQDDYATMTRPEYLTYAPADAVGETTGSALRLCVDGASACDVGEAAGWGLDAGQLSALL